MMCLWDINPYKANDIIDKRFQILSQKLQHQIDESSSFDTSFACLIHNLISQCKDTKCLSPHVCAVCGDSDHIAADRMS